MGEKIKESNWKEVLKEILKQADESGTGKFTFDQVKSFLLPAVGEDSEKEKIAEAFCRMADINGDKMIDSEELVTFIYDMESDPKSWMKASFRLVDANRDGFVCKKELGEFLKFSGQDPNSEDFNKMVGATITLFDWDSDGKLDYEEFCDWMNMSN